MAGPPQRVQQASGDGPDRPPLAQEGAHQPDPGDEHRPTGDLAEVPEGGEGDDPQFAQAVQMIKSVTDASRLEQMIGMFSMRVESVEDPDEKAQMQKLIGIASERLKELKAAAEN